MNTHLVSVVSALQQEPDLKRRAMLVKLAVASALPATPVRLEEPGDFYVSNCFAKAENIIVELNEHILMDYKDMLADVRINWESRIEKCFYPFRPIPVKCAWNDDLPKLSDKDLVLLGTIQKFIISAMV